MRIRSAGESSTRAVGSYDIISNARDAYIWGLYLVLTYQMRYLSTQASGAVNVFHISPHLAGPEMRPVVTPAATTLSASCFADLSREPLVIELPGLTGRYYALQVMDHYGDYFLEAGEPFTGTGDRRFILQGPGWKGRVPAAANVRDLVVAPSNVAWASVHVAVTQPIGADQGIARDFLARVTATALNRWAANGGRGLPPGDVPSEKGHYDIHPRMPRLAELVRDATAADYFEILGLCLNDPTFTRREDSESEHALLERLAMLGLVEGRTFEFFALDGLTRDLLEEGYRQGRAAVEEAFLMSTLDMHGWTLSGHRGRFGSDFLTRAVAAAFDWGGAGARSHSTAFQFKDSDGRPLTGAHRYALTLDASDLPPVRNHWELGIYGMDGYVVENEIGRYSLTSGMLARGELHASNGTVVVSIQHEPPADPGQRVNWLPAPPDGFQFTARFYGPYGPLLDGSYAMPPVVRID